MTRGVACARLSVCFVLNFAGKRGATGQRAVKVGEPPHEQQQQAVVRERLEVHAAQCRAVYSAKVDLSACAWQPQSLVPTAAGEQQDDR